MSEQEMIIVATFDVSPAVKFQRFGNGVVRQIELAPGGTIGNSLTFPADQWAELVAAMAVESDESGSSDSAQESVEEKGEGTDGETTEATEEQPTA